jgi:hypothetical protein
MLAHDDFAELKARVRLSDHLARKVKLSPPHGGDGGDRFGCCPFHDERMPSFTVNDARASSTAATVALMATFSTGGRRPRKCPSRKLATG